MKLMKGHSSLGKKCRVFEISAHRMANRPMMEAQVWLSNWLSGSLLKSSGFSLQAVPSKQMKLRSDNVQRPAQEHEAGAIPIIETPNEPISLCPLKGSDENLGELSIYARLESGRERKTGR